MHVDMQWRRWLSVATATALLAACGGDDHDAASGGSLEGTVLVFAAASLTDVVEDAADAFEQIQPDVDIDVNVAGSSSLREQILAGAPADVFAAAAVDIFEPLREEGELSSTEVLATNTLVIAVPVGNPGNVTGLESFADDSLLLGACGPGVPCGDLATEAFARAGVEAALDTEEPNVRALLTKVASGDLDAGLVYATDVEADPGRVEAIALPTGVEVTNAYPLAVLDRAPNPVAANAFVDFLLSAQGRELLADHGFGTP